MKRLYPIREDAGWWVFMGLPATAWPNQRFGPEDLFADPEEGKRECKRRNLEKAIREGFADDEMTWQGKPGGYTYRQYYEAGI